MNGTINATLNATSGVVINTVKTLPFWTSVLQAIIPSLILLVFFGYKEQISGFINNLHVWLILRKLSKKYDKNIILLKHHQSGFFGSMIGDGTLKRFQKAFYKIKDGDVDIIIHSQGGVVFHSMRIATMLKNYDKGWVRAVVPVYAMSGASMLSLACDEILIDKDACLGVVDPQLGTFFERHSSRAWDEVLKLKNKKADDKSVAMSFTGRKVTKTLKDFIRGLLVGKVPKEKVEAFLNLLVKGDVEHSFQLDFALLKKYDVPVNLLEEKLFKLALLKEPYGEVLCYSKNHFFGGVFKW